MRVAMRLPQRLKPLAFVLFAVLLSPKLLAHGLEPIFISLITMENHQYRVELRLPDEYREENSPYFSLPEHCQSERFNHLITAVQCEESLVGQELAINFDYFKPQISTLINYYDLDGDNELFEVTYVDSWTVPDAIEASESYLLYLTVGFEHILGGFDHILFIVCLLMIVKSRRQLIKTITGFTLAHSITLVLVSLEVIQPAIEPIELIVALSVLLLAYEIASGKDSLTHRHPVTVSFFCGLLHGVGFSSVLAEINSVDLVSLSAILFFNIGIELGQLLIVALWAIASFCASKLSFDKQELHKLRLISIYLTGGLSLFWVFDRFALWLEARAIPLFT